MTEPTQTPASTAGAKKRGGGLSSMLLADLKSMAGGLGIAGAGAMKKAQLVEAIKGVQGGGPSGPADSVAPATTSTDRPARAAKTAARAPEAAAAGAAPAEAAAVETPVTNAPQVTVRQRTRGRQAVVQSATAAGRSQPKSQQDTSAQPEKQQPKSQQDTSAQLEKEQPEKQQADKPQPEKSQAKEQRPEKQQSKQSDQRSDNQGHAEKRAERKPVDKQQLDRQAENQQSDKQQAENQQAQSRSQRQQSSQQHPEQGGHASNDLDHDDDGDGEGGSRRNRRRRGRDRDRQGVRAPAGRGEPDTTVLEDDVLVPAAGILDVLDNYAFVRTSGYLPGTDDVYLSLSMVRKFGLRRGDAVVGQVRQPREGERKEKFNPMVRIDSINGTDPESARERLEFEQFTPVHPTDRLRLETDQANLIGRVIDIAAPLGKGQRGLIVAPPKSGRTTILQSVARSISANNPECHLMVVLLDARPEEVTDFQRAVKGEVIASTFDRSPGDHTMLAELALERAKRLVELGHDVVVLLDSLTSLGRAYNVSLPASGRTLAGGVDAAAVLAPKQFFGAARNVEGGGSLTILATALVDTGSVTNDVFLEELGGTANMELRLRRELAEAVTFPAIDVVASGTRHESVLTSVQEAAITGTLRQQMSAQPVGSVASVLERLQKAKNNIEFLTALQRSAASAR